jgi:xanthine dehydrogenase large subunit
VTRPPQPPPRLHQDAPHESAARHVSGLARYVDDLPCPGALHGVVVRSPAAHGRLLGIDVPALDAGVVRVLTAADVPGENAVGPIVHDEPVLAAGEVIWKGQPVALVLGETREAARAFAERVQVRVEPRPALLGIEAAEAAGAWLLPPHVIARGDVDAALAAAPHTRSGEVRTPAQDHFYLETHVTLAIPEESTTDGPPTLRLLSSTQHPTEVQRMVAHVLHLPEADVVVEVPRLGGGFGGKESQASTPACLAALGAWHTGRPCKVWLDRAEDMRITGKRHPFRGRWRAGFDGEGRLLALDVEMVADGGATLDLTGPIVDRALFHLDNAYFVPALRFVGKAVRTNLPSNTAFRGFGGPQGVVVVEDVMERIAEALALDPIEVRRRNWYGPAPRDVAPYGARVPDARIGRITEALVARVDLPAWRAEIAAFNAAHRHHRRGLGFTPVKFGISFTNSLLNQAGALVLVNADGSVQLNHGGTEMGQGLHTKMRAVAADVFRIPTTRVRVMTTSTEKVPNTSPTAASSGSDLNGQAVRAACEAVKARMDAVAAEIGVPPERFGASFGEIAKQCWLRRVSLSSTGFYATPGIAYDRAQGRGTPFFYYAYGAALSEVEVNGWTGESRVRRVEVLHDVGRSLVPSIDRGQIEGAFVQGMGWLTTEHVIYGPDGDCVTRGPSTYKIPSVGDVPEVFRVELLPDAAQEGTVGGSKAVGEPPFLLATSVWMALRHAIAAFGDGTRPVQLALPATAEQVLFAVEAQR